MNSCLVFGLLLVAVCVFLSCEAHYVPVEIPCPANEVWYACGNSCQTYCTTLGKLCPIRHVRCPDGCYCKEGFARDNNRICIPIDQCPAISEESSFGEFVE